MQTIPHVPVLYREVLEQFKNIKNGIVIDCTMGYGGHTSLILDANPNIKLIAIDQDQSAIDFSTKRLEPYGDRVVIKKGRFSTIIKEILKEYDISDIRGILADIGVSSLQLDKKERGFSFFSENLDMRMDEDAPLNANIVINEYSSHELQRVLLEYGELRNYKQIASFIVSNRPFYSAKELSDALRHLMPSGKKIHPATLLMQAIRIEVNNELGELESLLDTIQERKFLDTKVAIISFHSLEDRIVKNRFNEWRASCICPQEAMRCTCTNDNSLGNILTKKPIIAQMDEIQANPRSRSAKLRVFEMKK
ncbi:methyltransferase [Sulfurimonas denitrificans DSM 1251]|uniref:Ribosomal RNA small subunit methyltransferase H n=1 Tax=Sulfurimonas denitrificans (strain ATCC 33889 / DSM 1251) TaxID=326298 RepID=RSMH_SULDN|nr:16S rRNA (cytosine(1402)-N(4))-methyltransferase RsmH [Sulfurimonas denitrificans]Q30SF5.1 RecName: Full=Ribosomal RNA small subunit methyltransferase H; AltName: Full=16S rRNA m(4)C1402 methyltransferase; AltName: Full=rRNA (cytosine-N(4)-)-methyltransferase RsmH [Sulfurimonas denitrificans DSM 1251]ABB44076.1 methyltransferase [Sulfurimonas denitrificans DSM 1251]MDD3441900.1 16S rRNA (cytosine(1402)-N(4))-methyltransferase RsmH [Sulfurimonas denitrificans]